MADALTQIIQMAQTLEFILSQRYQAEGRGLHEKLTAVENEIPEKARKQIRFVATIRNQTVHVDVSLAQEKLADVTVAYRNALDALDGKEIFDNASKKPEPKKNDRTNGLKPKPGDRNQKINLSRSNKFKNNSRAQAGGKNASNGAKNQAAGGSNNYSQSKTPNYYAGNNGTKNKTGNDSRAQAGGKNASNGAKNQAAGGSNNYSQSKTPNYYSGNYGTKNKTGNNSRAQSGGQYASNGARKQGSEWGAGSNNYSQSKSSNNYAGKAGKYGVKNWASWARNDSRAYQSRSNRSFGAKSVAFRSQSQFDRDRSYLMLAVIGGVCFVAFLLFALIFATAMKPKPLEVKQYDAVSQEASDASSSVNSNAN